MYNLKAASSFTFAKLDQELEETAEVISRFEVLDITTKADAIQAADLAQELRGLSNSVEALRKNQVGPFNDIVKQINGKVKPVLQSIDKVTRALQNNVYAFEKAEADRVAKRQAEAITKAADTQGDPVEKAKALVESTKTEPEKKTYAEVNTLVIDKLDKSKLPRQFLKPDESAIKAALRRDKTTQIMGVVYHWEKKPRFK